MSRKKKTRRTAAAAALTLIAGAALWLWMSPPGWLRPAPEVVAPAAPELLDPAVRGLLERAVAEASEEPRDAARHGKLGMIYEANSLWPEARDAYRAAAALAPRDRRWSYHLAVSTQEAGDFAGALAFYRELAAAYPSFAPVHQRLGLALLETGDAEAALEHFERLRQLAPSKAAGFVGAAMALRRLGRTSEAAARLERALELDPASRTASYQLGLAYRDLGREREAERLLARGVDAEIDYLADELAAEVAGYAVSLPATVERAEKLRRAGRHEEVAAIFERALATHPDNLTLLNNLGASYLTRGDFERARETLDRALDVGGGDPETLLNLAGLALAMERPEEALAHADRALALDARLARLHGVRAQALVKLRRYPEATASMEEALRLEVRDPALYVGLGVLYEADSRWSEARSVYERALDLWPELVPAHLGRGLAAVRLGDRQAAAESLAELRRLAPEHPRLERLRSAVEAM